MLRDLLIIAAVSTLPWLPLYPLLIIEHRYEAAWRAQGGRYGCDETAACLCRRRPS